MKRSLLSLSMIAFLILGVSACAPKPAAQVAPTSGATKTGIAVQADWGAKPADASTSNAAPAEGNVTSADALKVILLQWLVAR